jgi:mono/diheme cytochrome c family protein
MLQARAAEEDLGARLFFNHCAACHGENAEGGGRVAAPMRVTMGNLRTSAMTVRRRIAARGLH